MQQQMDTWQNEFGNAYTDRNVVEWEIRLPAFQTMLGDLAIDRLLEVGCNRGHNLVAASHCLSPQTELFGIEPNAYALSIAQSLGHPIKALEGNAFNIPFNDGEFDLVFTSNVLIHVSLEDLPLALQEIYRVSNRYILAIEYFAEKETDIYYRGHNNLLWKRNFPKHYQKLFPNLTIIRDGYWEAEDGFDRSHWWLFEK